MFNPYVVYILKAISSARFVKGETKQTKQINLPFSLEIIPDNLFLLGKHTTKTFISLYIFIITFFLAVLLTQSTNVNL